MRVHAYFMYIFLVRKKKKKKKKKKKRKGKRKRICCLQCAQIEDSTSPRLSQLQLLAIVFLQQTLSIHMPVKRKPVRG